MDIYKKMYDIIGNLTPLKSDCGLLCEKVCCKGDEDTGMYLYPGEERFYEKGFSFGEIKPTDFTYSYNDTNQTVMMLVCKGNCNRNMRPLACRIFPFVPYMNDEGEIDIEIDIRGDSICPLVKFAEDIEFDEEFLDKLAEAFEIAIEDDKILAFIKAQSELIDEYYDII